MAGITARLRRGLLPAHAGVEAASAGLRRAAVLVAIVAGEAPPGERNRQPVIGGEAGAEEAPERGCSVLLTLRAARLSAHAGQVALPGGSIEAGETPEAAALREAAEEIGLDPRLPEVIGRLPGRATGTGFHITPVVAILHPPFTLTPDPGEVAEIFRYPVSTLLDPAQPVRRDDLWAGKSFWVWPHERHLVWGATAEILRQLSLVLRG
ncbi:NUDIX hydrolase [Roseomonas elaeocarpi]|uniref:NUDIX hydrolase n=1 Tax=Roseomonas elaeocarpi TaxID=907779 RepID=A0ABV6JWA0_9PROT